MDSNYSYRTQSIDSYSYTEWKESEINHLEATIIFLFLVLSKAYYFVLDKNSDIKYHTVSLISQILFISMIKSLHKKIFYS